jgi:hypothetical protein
MKVGVTYCRYNHNNFEITNRSFYLIALTINHALYSGPYFQKRVPIYEHN